MKAIRQRTQREAEELRERFKVKQERLSRDVVSDGLEATTFAHSLGFAPVSQSLSDSFLEDFLREVTGTNECYAQRTK